MKKIILVAVDQNLAIGRGNRLPWQGQQREDMRRFKQVTMGFPIIMGRKTYESFPKRPLLGRMNIVVTRQASYQESGCVAVNSLEEAFRAANTKEKECVFVIGGAEIYQQALPTVDELYVTIIHHRFEADTFFPAIDNHLWRQTRKEDFESDETNHHPYSFIQFERRI